MRRISIPVIASLVCLLSFRCQAQFVPSATADLLRAAERGDAVEIQIELQAGADPNARNEADRPALFMAAASGNVDAVRALLDAGATAINELHLQRSLATTPLAMAAWNKNAPLFQLLLSHGADLKLNDYEALRGVVVTDWVETLRQMLSAGVDPNYRFKDGESPVTIAAMRGYVDALTVLVEHGGRVNGRDDLGVTPLIFASAQAQEGAVQFLLNHGADPSLMDTDAHSALQVAQQIKDPVVRDRIVAALLAHGASGNRTNRPIDDEFLLAAYRGDLAAVTQLLAKGADIGVRGVPNGTLWLRDALSASVAHPAVCRYLLEHGVSPYMRDSAGFSPLHAAAGEGHPDCIKLIIEQGVDPNLRSRGGDTPLQMAENRRRPPAVLEALRRAGAKD